MVSGGLKSSNKAELRNPDDASQLNHRLFSLTRLTIGNCDQLWPSSIVWMVGKVYMPNLEYLKLKKSMALAMRFFLDSSLLAASNIRHLCVPVDFLGMDFCKQKHHGDFSAAYSLDTLELDAVANSDRLFTPFGNFDLIFDAVSDGHFGNLRRLKLHRDLALRLGTSSDFDILNDYLKALAREDEEGAKYSEDQAGISLFGK